MDRVGKGPIKVVDVGWMEIWRMDEDDERWMRCVQ